VRALTAVVTDTARIQHGTSCASRAGSGTSAGSWRPMYVYASRAWTTIGCESDSRPDP
jgi:hypothetical protein